MGPSLDYLNRDIFGHWLLGRRLLDRAIGSFEPVSWTAVLALEVLLLGVCCVLLGRIVVALEAGLLGEPGGGRSALRREGRRSGSRLPCPPGAAAPPRPASLPRHRG